MMKKVWVGVCLAIAAAGCSGQADVEIPEDIAALGNLVVITAHTGPMHETEPQKMASFGDTDHVIIGQIGDAAVDSGGRLYIADRTQNVIHVYEPDGSHLLRVGSEGDGPGEFRRISVIRVDDRYLYVMDGQNLRISRFSLDSFRFLDDMVIPFEYDFSGGYVKYPSTFYVVDPDRYLIQFGIGVSSGQDDNGEKPKVEGRILNRIAEEFEGDKIFEIQANESIIHREGTSLYVMSPDYKRNPKVLFDRNGKIARAWTEKLLFEYYDLQGNYLQAMYKPYQNPALHRNDVLSEYADRAEPWRSMIRNDRMPETWPAFAEAVLDDTGRIWAALFTDDKETYTWHILSPEGELAAAFTWPRQRNIKHVLGGYVYTLETDVDTDLQQIVKYSFDLQ